MHELIVVKLDPTATLSVKTLEGLGELLDDDASTNKAVKGNAWRRACASAGCRLGSYNVYPRWVVFVSEQNRRGRRKKRS